MSLVIARTLIDRSREAIAASRASITRSRERIDESHRIIAKVPTFALSASDVSDEQHVDIADRWQAIMQQRQIDREIRRSVWGDNVPPSSLFGGPAAR